MKFSENWLRTFVNPPLASRELADVLTMGGIEVEAVEPAAPAFDAWSWPKCSRSQKHPDADRLKVCQVNAGARAADDRLRRAQRACRHARAAGAGRRAAAGHGDQAGQGARRRIARHAVLGQGTWACATTLPGCWCCRRMRRSAPTSAKILDLDDQLLTIKPTPNRGDCLSLLGMAREVAAMTGARADSRASATPVRGRTLTTASRSRSKRRRPARVIAARIVRGVNARRATPRWMVQRLERSGLR